jgi:hypothetical protein
MGLKSPPHGKNSMLKTANKRWSFQLGDCTMEHEANNVSPWKVQHVMKCYTGPQEFDRFFGMTQVKENGLDICNFECQVYSSGLLKMVA